MIIAIVALVALFTARSIATFWTDYLWYDSVASTGVWRTLVLTRVWMVVVASVVAFGLFWANLTLADRLSPRRPAFTGSADEEIIERFQGWMSPRAAGVRLLVAGFFGITLGLGAASFWKEFLYWRHGGSFGTVDPIYNMDVGFYVFDLPLYRAVFGWLFELVLVVALVTAALHYLNGGIQVQTTRRVTPGVKVHLSVLFALLALLKAVGYALDRWELLYSTRGPVVGVSYTDFNAQRPALNLLILISVVAAIIMLVNLRFRGWTLPLVAIGLWLFTSIVVGGLYPAIIQRFRVAPDERAKEIDFVAHNIEFTREAYDLTNIEVRNFPAGADLTRAGLDANQDTIDNIRLWDPSVLVTTYKELQEIRTFYNIADVDIDRYTLTDAETGDQRLTQVVASARELDEANIPGGGWVNRHLVYTHGFGAVISPANDVTVEGQPDFFVKDIPPDTAVPELAIAQPRIYFSDTATDEYLVANTNEDEADFPVGEGDSNINYNNYDGDGGIRLGGLARRVAFFLRFGDIDTLISNNLTPESRVLIQRNVRSRVDKVAPFLFPDADPYIVLIDGRLKWVVDLYSVSDRYPYSTFADTGRLDRVLGLPTSSFNYLRNPVKAVVDAYDGTITLYVVDEDDPLIQAQQRIFPGVFTDMDDMPDELRQHLRYPEDQFRIQSDVYTLYHMTNPGQFYSNVDPWQIAKDPATSERRVDLRNPVFNTDDPGNRPMLPYYLLMRLPGESDLSFIIMQPFTPANRPNMVSFVVAKSDEDDYGELIDFRFPAQSAQQGPGQVGEFINQDEEISPEFTLLGQGGSRVIQGSMLVIPIEQSLLYVQPIYLAAGAEADQTDPGFGQAQAETAGIPEFKRVVVSFNGQIVMRETLDDALAAIFGGGDGGGGVPPPGGEVPDEVAELLASAQAAFDAANAALRAGDLQTYADKIAEAQDFVDLAAELAGVAAAPETG